MPISAKNILTKNSLRFSVLSTILLFTGVGRADLILPHYWRGNSLVINPKMVMHLRDGGQCNEIVAALNQGKSDVAFHLGVKDAHRSDYRPFSDEVATAVAKFQADPENAALRDELIELFRRNNDPRADVLSISHELESGKGLNEETRSELKTKLNKIIEGNLTKLVPPEILGAALVDDEIKPMFSHGLFTGLELTPRTFEIYEKALGKNVPSTFKNLIITTSGNYVVSTETLQQSELVKKAESLDVSGYFVYSQNYLAGRFSKFLQSPAATNLKELTVNPFPPQLQREFAMSATPPINSNIEQITLFRELNVPVIFKNESGKPDMAFIKPEEFTYYDYPLLIKGIKKKFPSLKTLKIPDYNLSDSDKQQLSDLANGESISIVFHDPHKRDS